jgi:hypothetical protein
VVDISFEINGRKVSTGNVGDALEAAMLQGVSDSIKRSVGSLRCPEHGKSPKIICKGRSVDKLSFEVSACCQKLTDKVQAKLR